MTAILADENADHRVVHRLDHYGHDVEHVDFAPDLAKGIDDAAIAAYSLDSARLLLTSDDDFLTEFAPDEYAGLLFIVDESLSPSSIADAVHEIVTTVEDPSARRFYVSRNWL